MWWLSFWVYLLSDFANRMLVPSGYLHPPIELGEGETNDALKHDASEDDFSCPQVYVRFHIWDVPLSKWIITQHKLVVNRLYVNQLTIWLLTSMDMSVFFNIGSNLKRSHQALISTS